MTDTAPAAHAATPSTAPASGQRVSWDVIRVLALLEIVLFHDTYLGPTTEPGIPELPHAWKHTCGASILIMVSGYFATVTLGRHTPGRWLIRRLARLLPAYLVAVVVVYTVVKLFSPAEFSLHQLRWTDLVGNLFLLQQLLPNVAYIDLSWWTLPVQVAGFTAMALLVCLHLRGRAVMPILWAVVSVPMLIREIWMGDHPSAWLVVVLEGSGLCLAHLLVAGVAVRRWASGRLGTAHLALLLGVIPGPRRPYPHSSWTGPSSVRSAVAPYFRRRAIIERLLFRSRDTALNTSSSVRYGESEITSQRGSGVLGAEQAATL